MKFLFTAALLAASVSCIVKNSCGAAGKFAITFDGGPSPYTGDLLTTLRDRKCKATFHIVPNYLEQPVYLANIRQAVTDGHEIGLFLQNIDGNTSVDNFRNQVKQQMDQVNTLLGVKVVYIRLPSNANRPELVSEAEAMKLIVTGFNFDSMDYSTTMHESNAIYGRVKSQLDLIPAPAKGDFIIAFRDAILPTVQQTGYIVDYVREKGYDIVPLDDCVGNGAYKSTNKNSVPIPPSGVVGTTGSVSQKNTPNDASASYAAVTIFVAGMVAVALSVVMF